MTKSSVTVLPTTTERPEAAKVAAMLTSDQRDQAFVDSARGRAAIHAAAK